jgi:hypothetical protein
MGKDIIPIPDRNVSAHLAEIQAELKVPKDQFNAF